MLLNRVVSRMIEFSVLEASIADTLLSVRERRSKRTSSVPVFSFAQLFKKLAAWVSLEVTRGPLVFP